VNDDNDVAASAARILIVDDMAENLAVLGSLLEGAGYDVCVAIDGAAGLQLALQEPRPDLILLDIMMPGMDGYEVLRRLRSQPETRDLPVIFLTALGDTADEEYGLAQGAVDYLSKPIRPAIVLARVRVQIEAHRQRMFLNDQKAALEAEVERRMRDNELTQLATIRALAHLAETRDPETGNHILRTQGYVNVLARHLQRHPRFAWALDDKTIELLTRSAPLHDIGKVGIPDHVLLKPGKLDPDEWEVMKTHAAIGAEAIAQAERDIDRPLPFLAISKEIARSHHERWDGTGYPDGLRGDEIPISARLMAAADVFDALTTVRVYKKAMSYDVARDLILRGRGSQFDPDVVDAFDACFERFCEIADAYRDEPEMVC